ncbi:SDR family NAD(P)-dependent oxidoreductase [Brucella pseudogrignonensis]|uniref:SDR family NAD(P)-dependent oxidoreductase n=1 Tax=Brucella pseudogrignonensis TaxID=419475 RepID=UPI001EDC3783|nr:SDR family NAD(P)-dependent oxidoreductase [Brucella pseudogrignonensis]UKK94685.1 SDR family NAD(P)-dependent oxidoreductase [Brucella pseudogrignonensis]
MAKEFNGSSTTDMVLDGVDLTGKRVFVTGATSGLGAETARALVARGATVVGTARDAQSQVDAVAAIRTAARSGGSFRVVSLALDDLASVRKAADAIVEEAEPFDLIIANAGVMATPFQHTKDGFELQFGVNVIGHFILIQRLAPLMRDGARLIVLSSNSHRYADADLEDPNFEHTAYEPWFSYSRSKTGNALLALAFDLKNRDRGIRAASVHPGLIQTGIGRHLDPTQTQETLKAVAEERAAAGKPPFVGKTIPQGAATTVWAGVVADPVVIGGRYCEDCGLARTLEDDEEADLLEGGVRRYALDSEHALAYWAMLERLTGERS